MTCSYCSCWTPVILNANGTFYTWTEKGLNSLDKLFTIDNSTCPRGRVQWMSDDIKKPPQLFLPTSEVNGKTFYWLQREQNLAPSQRAHIKLLLSGSHLHSELRPRQAFMFWGAQTNAIEQGRAARARASLQLQLKAGLLHSGGMGHCAEADITPERAQAGGVLSESGAQSRLIWPGLSSLEKKVAEGWCHCSPQLPEEGTCRGRCRALLLGIQWQDTWEWFKEASGKVQTGNGEVFLYREGGLSLEQACWRGGWCPEPVSV